MGVLDWLKGWSAAASSGLVEGRLLCARDRVDKHDGVALGPGVAIPHAAVGHPGGAAHHVLDERVDVVGHELLGLRVVGGGVGTGWLGGCCGGGVWLAGRGLSAREGKAGQEGNAERKEQFET